MPTSYPRITSHGAAIALLRLLVVICLDPMGKGISAMFKKLLIVGAAVVAGVLILNMTVAGSYVSTAWKKVRAGACNKVPVEFEIERVRNEVSKLIPDMKDNIRAIAEEMVTVEKLRDDIASTRA